MSIETPDELERLKAVGQIVAEAIRAMRAHVRPGVTTRELDEIGGRVFARAGARSGPQLDYGFPGVNCISVNDEAVHGIPSKRRLRKGDLLKLDVTAELDGSTPTRAFPCQSATRPHPLAGLRPRAAPR